MRPARANDGETAAAPTTATSIGWAPHIFKGDNNKASNTSVEAQVSENVFRRGASLLVTYSVL